MQSGGAFRKKEIKRAYERGYGKQSMEQKRTAREHLKKFKLYQKRMAEDRKEFKDYKNSYDDLFWDFFFTIRMI